jgi:hypothetical protein
MPALMRDKCVQLSAVEHFDTDGLFEIACLAGGQVVVENDHVGVVMLDDAFQLFDLALAEIRGHVGRFATLQQAADHAGPRRFGQAGDFVERVVAHGLTGKNHANEDRLLARNAVTSLGFVHSSCWLPRGVDGQTGRTAPIEKLRCNFGSPAAGRKGRLADCHKNRGKCVVKEALRTGGNGPKWGSPWLFAPPKIVQRAVSGRIGIAVRDQGLSLVVVQLLEKLMLAKRLSQICCGRTTLLRT